MRERSKGATNGGSIDDLRDVPPRDVPSSTLTLEQTKSLLAGQQRVLESLATGAPLGDVLASLILVIELLSEGLLGSILVLEPRGGRFEVGVAPSLPPSYIEPLRRAPTSPPYLGPCGMAADLGVLVESADIDTDLRWSEQWRQLASSHGLRTCYSAPIVASSGETLGSFGLYYRERRDPTPPRAYLLETAAHLAAIAIEHDRSRAALEQADRKRNEFIAMLGHELRNPLGPILHGLEVLRMTGGDAQAVRRTSEMIEGQVAQLVRLVDDLLDVCQLSRGHFELRMQRVELGATVTRAVEAIRATAASKEHVLTVSLPPQPVYVDADSTRLAQVLGNLLSNACKFTDEGGRIWVTLEREGDEAVIRVRDTGIGIAENELGRVFEMFERVDASRQRAGLGIGLTLVKKLVELHGGTVLAKRVRPSGGSELVVRLLALPEVAEPHFDGPG